MYREIAGPGMHGRLRLNYAVALLNSGQIGPAYDLVSRARLAEGFDADLAEVEVRILEHIGDVEGANENWRPSLGDPLNTHPSIGYRSQRTSTAEGRKRKRLMF